MEGIEFLEFVWGKQPGKGVASLAYKDDEHHWQEEFFPPFTIGGGGKEWGDYATYFCPNLFESKRKKEQCLPGIWLWQDLDEVTPEDCDVLGWAPSLYWETSPGRYQGLWLMKQPQPPATLAAMNKALNRRVGADKGTWNLTRLLRVPGSYNGKRDCQVGPALEFVAALA